MFLVILMASLVGYTAAQNFVQVAPYTLTNDQRQSIGLIIEDTESATLPNFGIP